MADEEAELDRCSENGTTAIIEKLRQQLQELSTVLRDSSYSPAEASSQYCQAFCQTLLEYAGRWRTEEDPLPLVEVYTVALLSYAQASGYLSVQCESTPLVLERLSLSFVELLLSLKRDVPEALWKRFQTSVQSAHSQLQERGIAELSLLSALAQERGVWTNSTLLSLLSSENPEIEHVPEFLAQEGPVLLEMRIKQLIKENHIDKAVLLAKVCADDPEFGRKGHFRQTHLVCLCAISEQEPLMVELSKVDCRDALEMICNLESEGDERGAFGLCSAFLTRQLLQEDTYCAWELTLFWSKLLKRLESSDQNFLDKCRQMSLLCRTVFHILFFIKVIQSEMDTNGLPACIEMCIRALQMEAGDGNTKATICKTISCLLPTDLEVKRACQLTEFLLEPTVDAYYAVETLYNEPDQKLEEQNMPVPNSLRCELLLVFKTHWPFDPEFWDWKTLKRQCLALMGEEASIVSSIDLLNDSEGPEPPDGEDTNQDPEGFRDVMDCFVDTTNELNEITDRKQKNREVKKLREKGFISARFRNWQAYMQYCVLCDKEFLGHRIVRHAQTHLKDGLYSCPICTETFTSKDTLVPHVTSHVKLSCKERLTAMKTTKKLGNHKASAPVFTALKANTENVISTKEKDPQDHGELLHTAAGCTNSFGFGKEENACPVVNCRKGFKFLKNLLAHVKAHGDDDEAKRFLEMQSKKVVCQYCRRHFVSVSHLNDHLQVHCGVKPYVCIQLNCKASFLSNTELLVHKKEHTIFKARCMFPNCGKIFNEAYKLYDHEAQHYETFTCKALDCGKLFHSQCQLDLHQEEHRTKDEKSPATENGISQNSDIAPSLVDRMLSDEPFPSQKISQNNLVSSIAENSFQPDAEGITSSMDSLLNSSQALCQSLEPYLPKTEHPDENVYTSNELQYSNNSAIQSSINSHFTELNQRSLEAPPFDYFSPTVQNHPSDPYQAATEELQQALNTMSSTDILQAQVQLLKADAGATRYNDVPLPEQLQDMCVNNLLAAGQTLSYIPTGFSQPFPPAVAPLPPSGETLVNILTGQSTSTPSAGGKERHYCAFETCTRNYSSYRSVTKHMKATHPEFYIQWKLAKRNNKPLRTASQTMNSIANHHSLASLQNQQCNGVLMPGVQRPNVIQSHPFPTLNCPSLSSSQLASTQSQTGPISMENILNPIVLSQFGSTADQISAQSQVVPSPHWYLANENNELHPYSKSQVYALNMQDDAPHDAPSGVVAHGIPPHHVIASNVDRPAGSMQLSQAVNGSQPILSSSIDSPSGVSQQNSQRQSVSVSNLNSLEPTKAMQNPMESQFPQAREACQKVQLQDGAVNLGTGTETSKKAKRNKRTKWPAIVRDGKFICCRCFREFPSPKSLGGHLSKRAHCKALDESTEFAPDLPSSFLDLLNSEQTANASQPPTSSHYTSSAAYQNKAFQTVSSGSKDFTNSNYQQGNLSAYQNDNEDDILKQIMATTNISDHFMHSTIPQQSFPNPSGHYVTGDHLPESSVIQHTGRLPVKIEDETYRGYYLQPTETLFDNDFSDPILSQILLDNTPHVSSDRCLTDHSSNMLGPVTLKIKDEMKSCDDSNSGELFNNGLLSTVTTNLLNPVKLTYSPDPQHSLATGICQHADVPRKNIEHNVKRILREQILAGDFQRRNGLTNLSGADTSSSFQSPNSANQSIQTNVKRSGLHDMPPLSKKIDTVSGEHGVNCGIGPPSSHPQLQESPTLTGIVANHVDLGHMQLPAHQSKGMTIVQTEFGLPDIDKHLCDHPQTLSSFKPGITETLSVEKGLPGMNAVVKPFTCESNGCMFTFLSYDALLKHLIKNHNYTNEMVNLVKKKLGKFAPFCCQVCNKTFTRNSNLRNHYQSAHRLSPEEILNLKRNLNVSNVDHVVGQHQTSMNGNFTSTASTAHVTIENNNHQYSSFQDMMKQERSSQTFAQQTNTGIDEVKPNNEPISRVMLTEQNIPTHSQAVALSVIASTCQMQSQSTDIALKTSLAQHPQEPCSGLTPVSSLTVQYVPGRCNAPLDQGPADSLPACLPSCTNKQSKVNPLRVIKPKMEKLKVEATKKTKEKKTESNDAFSPYRPYRCVHQGCVAAFTIQPNLILHYRTVHQASLSTFEENEEHFQNEGLDEDREEEREEDPKDVLLVVTEFRCQERDCSRVFQNVPSLLQHYVQLHKFTLDKAGTLISSINLGRFSCDQQGCEASFTAFWKYIGHVKEVHYTSAIKLSRIEPVDGFQCDVEGCDRAYATKSNLLRHTMKKHQEVYQLQLLNEQMSEEHLKPLSKMYHHQITKSSNGKENIENNKAIVQKGSDKKRGKNNHWTKYGNPSLKTKEEASAMCTKKSTLQYPCMIKGCETVMKSERSIMKHYMGHGLSEKYLEEQRSHFIFCKKFPRQRFCSSRSEDTKSENSSDISETEGTADTGLGGSEFEYSKPVLRKRVNPDLFDRPSNDDSSEPITDNCVLARRKRGRPRKVHLGSFAKRKRMPRSTKNNVVYHGDDGSDSSSSSYLAHDNTTDEMVSTTSFKPMGFEMSFLKFLEESDQAEHCSNRKFQGSSLNNRFTVQSKDSCVKFKNPQQSSSLKHVTIVVDGAFSNVADLLLKQLQEMRPTVILEK